jgi:hypothetical protein
MLRVIRFDFFMILNPTLTIVLGHASKAQSAISQPEIIIDSIVSGESCDFLLS